MVVPETSYLRTGANRSAGNFPIPKKRNVFSPLAGTLHVFCRVLADQAGLFSVTAERKLLSCGLPRSERSRSDRGSQRRGFEDECYIQQTDTLRIDFLGK